MQMLMIMSEHYYISYKVSKELNSFSGGVQFGNTDFKTHLSYGGGGGGGGGSAFNDDRNSGGRGGNGGGLVYLQLEELQLQGTISAVGMIIFEGSHKI